MQECSCRGHIEESATLTSSYMYPHGAVTKRDRKIVENKRSRVKIKSKLTNFMKLIQLEGYNGKYGSNPQGIREIIYDLFEFDQIGR